MTKLIHRSLLAGSIMALVAACGGGDESENAATDTKAGGQNPPSASSAAQSASVAALYQRIEHDTPYLLAYDLGAMDRQLLNHLLEAGSESMITLQKQLEEQASQDESEDQGEGSQPDPMKKLAIAVLDEFAPANNAQAIERLGLSASGQMSISAIGAMPVLRMSLSDEEAFLATVTRIAESADMAMPEPEMHGEHRYWKLPVEDSAVIIGIGENWVNAGFLADPTDEPALETVLGIRAPERSLADAGTVADLNSKYGFDGISVGYIGIKDILDALTAEGDNRIKSSIASVAGEVPTIPAACQPLMRAVGEVMPRIVTGSTHTAANAMESRAVIEFTGETPTNLQAMAAPLPGMGVSSEESMMRLSFALDQMATRKVLNNLTKGIREIAGDCEWIDQESLSSIDQGAVQLGNPMFGSVKGLHLDLQSLELMPGMMMPSDVRAHALLASDNPLGLLGFAAMASPGIAQLEIETNSQPIALGPDIIPPLVPAPHMAASESALGFSVGEGHQEGLGDFLAGATADKAMLLRVSYDALEIAELMKEQMEAAAQNDPDAAATMEGFDSSQFTVFDWMEIQIYADENGLVMDQVNRIRD